MTTVQVKRESASTNNDIGMLLIPDFIDNGPGNTLPVREARGSHGIHATDYAHYTRGRANAVRLAVELAVAAALGFCILLVAGNAQACGNAQCVPVHAHRVQPCR